MVYVEYKKFGEEQISHSPVACERGSGILIPELVSTYNLGTNFSGFDSSGA
jgi:hypothetical protein